MNYLSWLIYAADVSNTVNWLCYLAVLPILVWVIITVFSFMDGRTEAVKPVSATDLRYFADRYNRSYNAEKDEAITALQQQIDAAVAEAVAADRNPTKKVKAPTLGSMLFKPVATLMAVLVVAIAVPSPITLYAIAASEVGEQVVTSRTAGLAIDALNRWLAKQAK